jgi:hypothetical protein
MASQGLSDCIEIYVHTTNIRGREKYHVPNFEVPFLDYIDIDTTNVDELHSVGDMLYEIQKIKNKLLRK